MPAIAGKIYPGQMYEVAKTAAPAPAKSADSGKPAASAPAAMPKTGMGGTSEAEHSPAALWTLGAIALAMMGSTLLIRKRAK